MKRVLVFFSFFYYFLCSFFRLLVLFLLVVPRLTMTHMEIQPVREVVLIVIIIVR